MFDDKAKDIIDLTEEQAEDYDSESCYRVNGKVIHRRNCNHKIVPRFNGLGENLSTEEFRWFLENVQQPRLRRQNDSSIRG